MSISTETQEQHIGALREACQELRARNAFLEAEVARLKTSAPASARPQALERWCSVTEVSVLLGYSDRWVRDQVKASAFDLVADINGEIRIAASSVNRFVDAHRLGQFGIAARSVGELRRKAGKFSKAA